jgi:mannose/cellobiose epimerase-like protein (N-acyl-D-glucosamine 2-epimerase family)
MAQLAAEIGTDIGQAPQRARQWMFDVAFPLWAERGFDSIRGGFVERMNLDTLQSESPFKRVRVQARQIYVFSHAHQMGWTGPGLERAAAGLGFLQKGWMPGRGWARVLSPDGDIIDPALDLYDQAFAMFALGWFHAASGDPQAARMARATLEAVRKHLRHPSGEGYLYALPPTGPLKQNPHMHMLEAMIVLARATGDEIYFQEARQLAGLFRQRFYDAPSGTLAEYYDDDWKRAPGAVGKITEPGHQLEWAWLLHKYSCLTGDDFSVEAKGLYNFAERHGFDQASGLAWDEVRVDGVVLKASSRLWPQTEALKANLAMLETSGHDTRRRILDTVHNIFTRYLDKPGPGMWLDHFEADGTLKATNIPASSLYHIVLAFSELMRVEAIL